jgi:hypothetical protein
MTDERDPPGGPAAMPPDAGRESPSAPAQRDANSSASRAGERQDRRVEAPSQPLGSLDASIQARASDADGTGAPPPDRGDAQRSEPEPLPPDLWDRAAAWVMQHGALPALGAITIAMAAIYWHMFAGELVGDDLSFHMAESARIADCLRVGDFDFWNPSANAGFASAYYYQVVPQLVSAIPAAVFGHHLFFFQLSVFLPLVLAPAAAYRGMRLFGASPWQAAVAALAIAFTNGESRWGTGNAGTFQVGLYTQTWALAAFPMALGHAARWATQGRGLAPSVAWGAFVTLCHPFAGVSLAVALFVGWGAQFLLWPFDLAFAAIGADLRPDPRRGALSAALARLGERWRNPPRRAWLDELRRLAILAVCLVVAWMPIWLPLGIDYAGFGGFPHRVDDEVGPGFGTLARWYTHGALLDFARPVVLTWTLPFVFLLARARFLRWLWMPAVVYALWLGLGPHLGKTDDDLIPAVRFLGAMQVVLSLAIGAGAVMLLQVLWRAEPGSHVVRLAWVAIAIIGVIIAGALGYVLWHTGDQAETLAAVERVTHRALSPAQLRWIALIALAALTGAGIWLAWRFVRSQYAVRTALAAGAAALGVLLALPGTRALAMRVHVIDDNNAHRSNELHLISLMLQAQPPGRKQVGKGAENHWWNLLSYEYGRRPALLMMGGGGLQASPNYDFLWNLNKDHLRNAWVYDAPYLVFERSNAGTLPAGDVVAQTEHYVIRRLPAPGLVSPVEVIGTLPPGRKPARAAALGWLKGEQPLKDRVLAYDGSGGAGGPPHGTVARAFRQDSPGDAADIYAEVDVTATTTFMARESWHPRWRAYLDGAPAPVRRLTPDFFGVDAPPGHHILAFRFERPWWAQAAWLAWPLVPLLAWLATRRRRAAATSPKIG